MGLGIKRKLIRLSRPLRSAAAARGVFLNRNDRRLYELKDKHRGERCVLIGMGPSFRPDDLSKFSGFTTFACNKIFLAMEDRDWSPDYYLVSDILVAQNNREKINSDLFSSSQRVYPPLVASELNQYGDPIIMQWTKELSQPEINGFLEDPIQGFLGGGRTVVFEMIQLAHLMGFAEVYFVGVDFSFDLSRPTAEKCRSGEVLISGGETNHFHPDYRKPGETWTVPMMDEMREAFAFAASAFKSSERKLFNASRESQLDVVERKSFTEVFESTESFDS